MLCCLITVSRAALTISVHSTAEPEESKQRRQQRLDAFKRLAVDDVVEAKAGIVASAWEPAGVVERTGNEVKVMFACDLLFVFAVVSDCVTLHS